MQIILHTLLSAGGETTSSLIGNAVRLLADDQELQQLLREKPALIGTFVEEALRLESPFRQQMRSIPHDTTLGGIDIPSGATVVLLFGAANRDPAQFENADFVDLNRGSPRRHLAFGRWNGPDSSPSILVTRRVGRRASWSVDTSGFH